MMRELSKSEKQCVKKIVEGVKNFPDLFDFSNFDGILIEYSASVYSNTYEVSVLYHSSIAETFPQEKYEGFLTEIAQVVNLVDYLLLNNYTFLIKPAHGIPSLSHLGTPIEINRYNANKNEYLMRMSLTDKHVQPFFAELMDKYILPTEALIEYVNNGYKTTTELHNNRMFIISIIAVAIALYTSVASMLIQVFNK